MAGGVRGRRDRPGLAHHPPPRPRPFSAAETAQILQASQSAVNSARQRARATLQAYRASGRVRPAGIPDPGAERALAERFTATWHARDIPALVSALAVDCLLTMPPAPLAYRGRDAIGADGAEHALDQPHVRPMDFTGRPMKSVRAADRVLLRPPALRARSGDRARDRIPPPRRDQGVPGQPINGGSLVAGAHATGQGLPPHRRAGIGQARAASLARSTISMTL